MLQFVDEIPPKSERGGRPPNWLEEAAQLRERPFHPALMTEVETPKAAGALVNQIRNGKLVAFAATEEGRFDATARLCKVYVTYIPTAAAPLGMVGDAA